jgi:hypothetical protein
MLPCPPEAKQCRACTSKPVEGACETVQVMRHERRYLGQGGIKLREFGIIIRGRAERQMQPGAPPHALLALGKSPETHHTFRQLFTVLGNLMMQSDGKEERSAADVFDQDINCCKREKPDERFYRKMYTKLLCPIHIPSLRWKAKSSHNYPICSIPFM